MTDLYLISVQIRAQVNFPPLPGADRIYLCLVQGWEIIFSILIPTTADLCRDPSVWSGFLPIPCLYDSFCVLWQECWDTGGFCACLPGVLIITCMSAPLRSSLVSCPISSLSHERLVEAYGKEWQVDTDFLHVWGSWEFEIMLAFKGSQKC